MESTPNIATVASLFSDPARAAMLWLLIDGRAKPAGELAFAANISAQSASGHLSKLLNAELLQVEVQGRHRYYRLANHAVALALESLAAASTQPAIRPLPISREPPPAMRFARTCYDHLAGQLAVKLLTQTMNEGLLVGAGKDLELTPEGEKIFIRLGLDMQSIKNAKRKFACACLDWSERQPHLGGALGAAFLGELLCRKWLLQVQASRILHLTPEGRCGLQHAFNFTIS
ncbi:MAG: ArsR/SmtB family transcription factor [Sulfuriferula sp.]